MSAPGGKLCRVCHKDVSNEKRVKDAQGNYYCAACHEAALRRQQVPAGAVGAATNGGGDDDLVPMAPTAKPTPRPAAVACPGTMPEFCPACGAKVLPHRKLCIKCNRDVTQMEKVMAMRAEEAKGDSREVVMAKWVGGAVRVALGVVVLGVVVVLVLIFKGMFFPGGLWDNCPTTREAAVREFLKDIATGSAKSYDEAFLLISFRERTTNKGGEDAAYKQVFTRMHDDFSRKYGNDWYSKIKLENLGSNDRYPDDEVDYRLTLGTDTYTIATQVQLDVTTATANMTLPRNKKPVYGEDGNRRFGILDIAEYKVHDVRHMVEVVGPGQPETLDPPGGGMNIGQ